MERKGRFAERIRKYKHAWVFLYILVYMPWFLFLERHVTTHYHVIQTKLDEWIPFNEFFIIPYLMWFAFIAAAFLYFFFKDIPGFYKLAKFMFTGMTVFLIVSTVFPNGQDLRPAVFARDNIFVDMVRVLYRADTCTNVFPSLHVFNSLGVCIAVQESAELRKHPCVCGGDLYTRGTDHPCDDVFKTAFHTGCDRSRRDGVRALSVRLCGGEEKGASLCEAEETAPAE